MVSLLERAGIQEDVSKLHVYKQLCAPKYAATDLYLLTEQSCIVELTIPLVQVISRSTAGVRTP